MNEIVTYRSSVFDRIILALMVPAIYFEANLPYFDGASTPFMFFAFVIFYLLITKMKDLIRLLAGKHFIACLLFALLCVFIETIHTNADYEYIFRFLNMTIGIFCIALLCRDKIAIDIIIFSSILSSAIQSIILISGTFSILYRANAKGFNDASHARLEAFQEFFLHGHLNDISFYCAIGTTLGIIAFFYETKYWKKIFLIALIVTSVLGVFLPLSRTGAFAFFVLVFVFISKSKIRVSRWILPLLALTAVLMLFVPEVAWVRIASITNISELQQDDSRTKVFSATLNHIGNYAFVGVGSGNYWHGWAVSAGITGIKAINTALGAHNAFLQVWMNWGIFALLFFCYLIYLFYSIVDKNISNDRRKASMYIFLTAIPIIFLLYHSFYQKIFSIGIGMLIGSRYWNIFDENSEDTLSEMPS